jgi:hypothetical protein
MTLLIPDPAQGVQSGLPTRVGLKTGPEVKKLVRLGGVEASGLIEEVVGGDAEQVRDRAKVGAGQSVRCGHGIVLAASPTREFRLNRSNHARSGIEHPPPAPALRYVEASPSLAIRLRVWNGERHRVGDFGRPEDLKRMVERAEPPKQMGPAIRQALRRRAE